jgi:hypothetical protein
MVHLDQIFTSWIHVLAALSVWALFNKWVLVVVAGACVSGLNR